MDDLDHEGLNTEECPKCGTQTAGGYGLMGGGIGPYVYCMKDECDWMYKVQDTDE